MFRFILACCVAVFFIRYLLKYRKLLKICAILKHDIKSYPLLGISYLFIGNNQDHMNAIETIGRETIKQGGIIAAWFGHKLYFCIADPVIAEIVLKTCLEKDDLTRFTKVATGNGTIFAPVPVWRRRRRTLIPSFCAKNLSRFVHIFAKQSQTMIEQLEIKMKTVAVPVTMWPYLHTNSLDFVSEATLGIQLNAQKQPDNPFMAALAEGTHLIAVRTCQPWLHNDFIYKHLPSYKKLINAVTYSKKYIDEIINLKRKQMDENHNSTKSEQQYKTFLELLLESNVRQLSNLELQEEFLTLLVAGTDTSAVATGFALLMLARYPDVQDKVYQEIEEVIGDSHILSVTSEDLLKLKYLDVVIKETLRLYPPGVVALRKIDKDVSLPTGVTLPAGYGATINIWALHRNPKYWGADAEQFRPERFLDTPFKHPAQFMPFSYGPRNCIGYRFAMLSMKTTITTLLRNHRVLPMVDNFEHPYAPRLKFDFILKDFDDFKLRLEKR